jgi:hypothetical protein
MRFPAWAFAAAGTFLASASAQAQTYDPSYPVCLHVFGPVGYYECRYISLPQCKAFTIGRPVQCVVNPYFAGVRIDRPPARHWRHRRRAYQAPAERR